MYLSIFFFKVLVNLSATADIPSLWLYVLVMSCTRFRVNPHSRSVWQNSWVFVYKLSGSGFESSCIHLFLHLYWIYFYGIFFWPWFYWLFSHTFFSLRLDSSKIFWKALIIVMSFLSFKRISHAYLLKISITQQIYLQAQLHHPQSFLSKNYRLLKQVHADIHRIYDFYQC